MLAEKAGIEVRSLKSWDGVIDMNAVDDAMKKFADSSKDNFKYGTKLPIPKTLNKMLRRDEAVAANAFKE